MTEAIAKTRKCSMCKRTFALFDFSKDRRKLGGYAYKCLDCDRRTARERAKAHYQKSVRERERQRGKQRQLERPAKRLFQAAFNRGEINKPDKCSVCHSPGKLHGHHDDYTKPLEVRWLCIPCHGIAHRKPSVPDHLRSAKRGERGNG